MKPYTEEKISKNTFIRVFDEKITQKELAWHRDKEDRIFESIGETDWLFQLDNELPKKIEGKMFIPKEVFHRAIKGTGDLKIKLTKL